MHPIFDVRSSSADTAFIARRRHRPTAQTCNEAIHQQTAHTLNPARGCFARPLSRIFHFSLYIASIALCIRNLPDNHTRKCPQGRSSRVMLPPLVRHLIARI